MPLNGGDSRRTRCSRPAPRRRTPRGARVSDRWREGVRRQRQQSLRSSCGRLYPRTRASERARVSARRLESLWRRGTTKYSGVPSHRAGGDRVLEKRHHRWGSAFASGVASIAVPGAARAHARGLGHRVLAGALAGSLVLAQAPMAWAQAGPRSRPRAPTPGSPRPISPPRRSTTATARRSTRPATTRAPSPTSRRPTRSSRPRTPSATSACARTTSGTTRRRSTGTTSSSPTFPTSSLSQGDDLRKREAEIKAMPGKVHIDSTPTGATVAIDDKPAERRRRRSTSTSRPARTS